MALSTGVKYETHSDHFLSHHVMNSNAAGTFATGVVSGKAI
jgi:hypothetical protein